MSAKELCAMLITRSLKDLNDDEENIVVDYLEQIGIEVDLDTKPREMCQKLLEKTMEKELGKKIPITAYANNILSKEKEVMESKKQEREQRTVNDQRKKDEKALESMNKELPGCIRSTGNLLSKNLYSLVVDPDLGIVKLKDGTSQYIAAVGVSNKLYNDIFTQLHEPILELTTSKGNRGYARIVGVHDGPNDLISVSPLISYILKSGEKDGAFISFCSSIPKISKIKFTYYGNKLDLNNILPNLMEKLPEVINAFSYLSLGMILQVVINNKEQHIRVDGIYDENDRPIFAGLIPFIESDLPFEIEADLP